MASVSHGNRVTLAKISFVILVIIIPVSFGIGWNEHRRTDALEKESELRRKLSYESCLRVNALRVEHNRLLARDQVQARILLDYMRLDIAVDPNDTAERIALKSLLELYSETMTQKPIALIDCQKVYPTTKEE